MIVYVDITQLEKGRANTGIQRVVKEFLKRASLSKDIIYKIIIKNDDITALQIVDNSEIEYFLKDMQNYQFEKISLLDLSAVDTSTPTAFFDIDSNWNILLKRTELYPLLKKSGFLIFNFIYDLIPMILPQFAHETTAKNFSSFIDAVYNYSDLVMFDSLSAKNDFIELKDAQNISRDIHTRVIGLGSDFLKVDIKQQDPAIKEILDKKYILFVGTIEPRKNQADVIEAFETIAQRYPDLNLVLIGRKGWKVDALIQKILSHPLKDKQLFWLNDIDDNTLSQFYQNAFLVTYLSKYEGYGLPIAESLSCGNITITSKNSSMYEVGKDVADYVVYNSLNELVSLITLYCDHKELYEAKKRYIKENFKTTSWEQFYTSIADILKNFEKSLSLKQNHLKALQFVFISIDKHNLEGTIKAIDKHMNFVKEYIIVTQVKLLKEFQELQSSNKITLIDENEILTSHVEGFSSRDHQSKNWLLRASLLNLESLDDEFIMLDDDNRPLKEIGIEKFIAQDGSYNAYYFHNLLDWSHATTEYDKGQQNMKKVLSDCNYELLSYSSHAPQIINKKIFKEVVDKFFDIGLKIPIDEWSIYFNYAVSLYPYSFNKKIYETLSWPANPADWESRFSPKEYSFENYYKELYDIEFFKQSDTFEDKLNIKEQQLKAYRKSSDMFDENRDILSKNNMVHTIAEFKSEDMEFYLSNIPYFVVVEQDSDIKLSLNYKFLNPSNKAVEISLVIFLDGGYRTLRHFSKINTDSYQESIIEMSINSKNLKEDIYVASFNIMINNRYIYNPLSPYTMKLIVVKDKTASAVLGNPTLLESTCETEEKVALKTKIKSIPILGWCLRWGNNLLRLNNLKHRVHVQQKQIENLNQQLDDQQFQIQNLKQDIKFFKKHIDTAIAKEISFQSVSFQQRIDQFIFDAKIDLKNEKH
ncbi:MAG: glycosyltransferase family 1 protein [Campylobacterota bacterium]|nr:glycosyltransferase family 1 protein [Campylobacterota bacterium]